jgi:hypothetical protein
MKKNSKNRDLSHQSNHILLVAIAIVAILVVSVVIAGKGGKGGGGGGKIKAQCNDGLDNDGDGYCDFLTSKTRCRDGSTPGDLDCASKDDNKEEADCIPVPERCDGFDNNCNLQVDEGLPVACASASNCGTTGWVGTEYCGTDDNVHKDWISFQCNFPGSCSSSCSSQTEDYIFEYCSNGCSNGACLPNATTPVNTCTDSDGGYNPNVYGVASGEFEGNPYNAADYCSTSTNLVENYCSNGVKYTSNVYCAYNPANSTFGCVSGAC